MRRVAVVGVGHSKFGVRKDVNLSELTYTRFMDRMDLTPSWVRYSVTTVLRVKKGEGNLTVSPALHCEGLPRCEDPGHLRVEPVETEVGLS